MRVNTPERNDHDRYRGIVIADKSVDLVVEKRTYSIRLIDLPRKAEEHCGVYVKDEWAYPEDKLLILAQAVKDVVDDKAKYTDWSRRKDIKAELRVDLIILLAGHDYPPVDRDEVYREIFEQAENFKKYA